MAGIQRETNLDIKKYFPMRLTIAGIGDKFEAEELFKMFISNVLENLGRPQTPQMKRT